MIFTLDNIISLNEIFAISPMLGGIQYISFPEAVLKIQSGEIIDSKIESYFQCLLKFDNPKNTIIKLVGNDEWFIFVARYNPQTNEILPPFD